MLTDKEKLDQAEANQERLNQERMERCKPVARKLLAILNEHIEAGEIEMGENDKVQKSLTPVAEEVIAMFLKEDINWADRHIIHQLAMQPLSFLGEVLQNALDISWDRAQTKKWGKESLDLKFTDVHEALGGGDKV